MKIIGLFSAVIVLLLACFPCCLATDLDGELTTHENNQPSDSENPSSHPPCSPFYSCSCCFGFSFQTTEIPLVTAEPTLPELPQAWYCLQKSDGHAHLPLQPPDTVAS